VTTMEASVRKTGPTRTRVWRNRKAFARAYVAHIPAAPVSRHATYHFSVLLRESSSRIGRTPMSPNDTLPWHPRH
jgi:hypothetical protein